MPVFRFLADERVLFSESVLQCIVNHLLGLESTCEKSVGMLCSLLSITTIIDDEVVVQIKLE